MTNGYFEIFLGFCGLPLLLLYLLLNWHQSRNLPITKWPLLGMSPGLISNAHRIQDYFTGCLKQFPTFEFTGPCFSSHNFLITSDPANVHYMLSKNFSNFEKGSNFNKFFHETMGDGIFISESESWATLRRSIHSLVKNGRFQQLFVKTIQDKVEKGLIPILEHFSLMGTEVDLQDLFTRFTFDNVCMFVLGTNPRMLSLEFPVTSYLTGFDDVEEALLYRHIVPETLWRLQKWLQIGRERKLSRGLKEVEHFIFQSISSKQECLRAMKEEAPRSFDFLTCYLQKDGEWSAGIEVSDKFLRDTAINLLAAGKDSVSAALSWFFWLIATHPLVESKIWEEIRANCTCRDEKESDDDRPNSSKLVYLHGAMCETLRLFPPVPIEHKAAVKADILPSGHKIGADSEVLFSLYAMGRMESIWGPDCLEFKPERWISERGGIVHVPSYKFIAFNAGPRSCLGKDMTFVQMKMVAIAIISNYRFQLVEGHPVRPSTSIILHMEHGFKVKVTKRNASIVNDKP